MATGKVVAMVILLTANAYSNAQPPDLVSDPAAICIANLLQCYGDLQVDLWMLHKPAFLWENKFRPRISQLCAPQRAAAISACLTANACQPPASLHHQVLSEFYKAHLQQVCSITSINWKTWEAASTKTCMNDQARATAVARAWFQCLMAYNQKTAKTVTCGSITERNSCLISTLGAACGPQPYSGYIDDLTRAVVNATMATVDKKFTEPPYNC